MLDTLPTDLARLFRGTPGLREAYLVGGCVRDWKLGIEVKDFDIEVFGTRYEQLVTLLKRHGKVDLVGRSFGVVKWTSREGHTHDFSLPRRDSKVGAGHKGFRIETDPDIEPREAAARRDFTINALMVRVRDGELLDFFGGLKDLREGVLRHTSDAFVEDPLRVLRGMQFAGRFDLRAAPETQALCRSIVSDYPELARERVRDEWFKWASRSVKPSAGLRFLEQSGWLVHFPELFATVGVPQDPEWHPEGDVWTHTAHCTDAMAALPAWKRADTETRLVLQFAMLLHDIGKATTTAEQLRDGRMRWISPGHETAGATLAESFLSRIGSYEAVTSRVLPLVAQHMAHLVDPTPRAIRRLARRLAPATIEELCLVMTADASGRPPKPAQVTPTVQAIRDQAATLALTDAAPRPILLGRHLLELGMKPGPQVGRILSEAFEAQIEGEFHDVDGARAWLAGRMPVGG